MTTTARFEPVEPAEPQSNARVPAEPAAVWNQPLSSEYGRIGITRVAFRVQPVTIVGGVPFEPGMVRVRTAGGAVHRTLREYVTAIASEPDAESADPWAAELDAP